MDKRAQQSETMGLNTYSNRKSVRAKKRNSLKSFAPKPPLVEWGPPVPPIQTWGRDEAIGTENTSRMVSNRCPINV